MLSLIVEGCDGAGKTTLIESLCEMTGAISQHHGPYEGLGSKALYDKYAASIDAAMSDSKVYIFDRSWISETAYGPVFRNDCRLSTTQTRLLTRRVLRSEPSLVICDPGWDAIQPILERQGYDSENLARARDVHIKYFMAILTQMTKCSYHTMKYDYTSDRPEHVANKIATHIFNPTAPRWTYEGFRSAPILVVESGYQQREGHKPGCNFGFGADIAELNEALDVSEKMYCYTSQTSIMDVESPTMMDIMNRQAIVCENEEVKSFIVGLFDAAEKFYVPLTTGDYKRPAIMLGNDLALAANQNNFWENTQLGAFLLLRGWAIENSK